MYKLKRQRQEKGLTGMFSNKLRQAEKRQGNIKLASNLYTCLNDGSILNYKSELNVILDDIDIIAI